MKTATKIKTTSIDAFISSREKASKHREIILSVLGRSEKPLSSQQISSKCELSYMQVVRRMSELRDAGKILESDREAVNSSNCKATRWQLCG